ncbi:agouti signaling protein 1 [Gadus macrocephalus]|uniref:agouti signaling protein 1 n=1 Tax=Gadus macrocephalus TaxID=80720 RepID=UPI0028CB64D1|nr:agouti signaling protein 1 [Gadus macrocephalus]
MKPMWLLLCLMALSSTGRFLVSSHMMPEDRLVSQWNATEHPLSGINVSHSPSIEIVELSKAVKKNKKAKKQRKQNDLSERKKRPPPPAGCVPLWGSCNPTGSTCCDGCSVCRCRLFKTVCYCRMGNPRC